MAITDHEALSGHVKALKHIADLQKKNKVPDDFKLVLGNEIYLTRNDLTKENYEKGEFFHFLLLAKDEIGHRQLRELSSKAWKRSFMHFLERVPTHYSDVEEVIGENKGHLIATTACLGGFLGKKTLEYLAATNEALKEKTKTQIKEFISWCIKWFGDDFYFEMQPSLAKEQQEYNRALVALSEKFNVPLTIATDTHYLKNSDRKIHEAYLNAKDGERELADFYASAFMMTSEEIIEIMNYCVPESVTQKALDNTLLVADKCKPYDLFHKQVIPRIPLPPESEWNLPVSNSTEWPYLHKFLTSEDIYDRYYARKILSGLFEKATSEEEALKFFARVEQELEEVWLISEKVDDRLSSYFVTTAKIIEIMWEGGDSLVGVSRGSAAGFLTNYLLGIVQINPLYMGIEMPHWRFVHRDRPELPDIDLDSQGSRRDQIFEALRKYFVKNGGDAVNVCTFGTEGSKSAIQTACRGLGYDSDIGLYISSLIPVERGKVRSLAECYHGNKEEHIDPIRQFIDEVNKYPNLWNVASQIEGLIKQRGIHASGVIPVNGTIPMHNAIMKAPNGALTSQFELYDSEYMGGIKIDLLTIEALDKIRVTMNLLLEHGLMEWEGSLKKTYDRNLHPDVLDYDSQTMWEMVAENKVTDLFQFDSVVGLEAAKKIKPKNLLELAQANSLMRLMPDGRTETPTETFIRYKEDINRWYVDMRNFGLHENEIKILSRHLALLNGVADSQESIMLLVMDSEIANFTVSDANKLRKGVAKKQKDIIEQVRGLLYQKGAEAQVSQRMLDYVWNVLIHRQVGYSSEGGAIWGQMVTLS